MAWEAAVLACCAEEEKKFTIYAAVSESTFAIAAL
jgi:hypothetical protein